MKITAKLALFFGIFALVASCAGPFTGEGSSVSFSLTVPAFQSTETSGFYANEASTTRAISASTAFVWVTVSGEGMSTFTHKQAVAGGHQTIVVPGIERGRARHFIIETFDCFGSPITRGTADSDVFGGDRPIPVKLLPETSPNFPMNAPSAPSVLNIPAGKTAFSTITITTAGSYQILCDSNTPCWLSLFNMDGSPAATVTKDESDGWVVVNTNAANQQYYVCVAAPQGEAISGATIGLRYTYFVSSGASGSSGKLPSAPCSINLLVPVDLSSVFISEGSYAPTNDINLNYGTLVYGGFKPGTWERNIGKYVTKITNGANSVFRFTGGSTLRGLDGLTIKYTDNANGPSVSAVTIETGTGKFLMRHCNASVGNCSYSSSITAYTINGTTLCEYSIYDNAISAGTISSSLTGGGTSAAIYIYIFGTSNGKISIHNNQMLGGTVNRVNYSAYVLYLNLSDLQAEAAIFDNCIYGATINAETSNSSACNLEGTMQSNGPVRIYRNYLYGGNLLTSRTNSARGISDNLSNPNAYPLIIANNVISGGYCGITTSVQNTATIGIFVKDYAYIANNTIDAGFLMGGDGLQQDYSTGISVGSAIVAPPVMYNNIIYSNYPASGAVAVSGIRSDDLSGWIIYQNAIFNVKDGCVFFPGTPASYFIVSGGGFTGLSGVVASGNIPTSIDFARGSAPCQSLSDITGSALYPVSNASYLACGDPRSSTDVALMYDIRGRKRAGVQWTLGAFELQ